MENSSPWTTAPRGALLLEDSLRRWAHRVAAAHLLVLALQRLPTLTPSVTGGHQHGTLPRAHRTLTPTTAARLLPGMRHPELPTHTRTVERRLPGVHPPEHRTHMLRVALAVVVVVVVDGAVPRLGGTRLGEVQLLEGRRGVTTVILGVAGCVTSLTFVLGYSY